MSSGHVGKRIHKNIQEKNNKAVECALTVDRLQHTLDTQSNHAGEENKESAL